MSLTFDPNNNNNNKIKQLTLRKQEDKIKSFIYNNLISEELKEGLLIDVKEIICGDPNCAPIDTVITLVWEPIGKGIYLCIYQYVYIYVSI
jgi:hypothetical protein